MKVGFLSNQLDNRGTGNALFDYAHFNETILNNESSIYTFVQGEHNPIANQRFEDRFGTVRRIRTPSDISGIDVLYHIKYGTDDGFRPNKRIRYAVHSVFEIQPHGERYGAVSEWLSRQGKEPVNFVPHMINLPSSEENYLSELGIPYDDYIVGRHGGFDTFDIPFVWDAVEDALHFSDNLHFLFMNTKPNITHPRIHYLPEGGPLQKAKFLNSCDIMLHARQRGETFGIAVGEFAVMGKPVMTYAHSGERAHIEQLGSEAYLYAQSTDIVRILLKQDRSLHWAYREFTPANVMEKFKEVFLD